MYQLDARTALRKPLHDADRGGSTECDAVRDNDKRCDFKVSIQVRSKPEDTRHCCDSGHQSRRQAALQLNLTGRSRPIGTDTTLDSSTSHNIDTGV